MKDSCDIDRERICAIIRAKYEHLESKEKLRLQKEFKPTVVTKKERKELSDLMYKK